MAVVNRHLAALTAAGSAELTDMMRLVQLGVSALTAEYRPDGFNVGLNQGSAAGAGIADHLHMHVVPRWSGDSSFISTVGNTRVLPETLETTWERLKGRLSG
jgi:ATP adenylyltransferase